MRPQIRPVDVEGATGPLGERSIAVVVLLVPHVVDGELASHDQLLEEHVELLCARGRFDGAARHIDG